MEQAILIALDLKSNSRRGATTEVPTLGPEESLAELAVLAETAGAEVVETVLQSRESAEAATLIGSGKVIEIANQIQAQKLDVAIFDRDLSPTQLRNLERSLGCKVLDRTQLILDIFASRARTREGQLQVELAQLNYLLPRLAGRGTQMSRLGGGIGTRGPGETQLETDRRRIFRRLRKIEQDLESVRAGRAVQRRQRQAVPLATISLVGYTNAGKSTLFNRLTNSDVVADSRMFATLDPTVRQLRLPSHRQVLVSDTVGFIANLPTTLVKAFRATLEEVTEASVLLHVIDITSEHASVHSAQVKAVLDEIGVSTTPQILVLNKMDRLPGGPNGTAAAEARSLAHIDGARAESIVSVSALTGEGIDELLQAVEQVLPVDRVSRAVFHVPHEDGSTLHLLHEYARVIETKLKEEYAEVVAEAPESVQKRLAKFVVPRAVAG